MQVSYKLVVLYLALCGMLSAGGLTLGHVTNDLSRAGGCALQLPSEFVRKAGQFIFVSDRDGHALVNLDDADQDLTLMRAKYKEEPPQPGAHSSYWYDGPNGLAVEVDYTVTATCPSNDRDCGVISYEARLYLSRGKQHKTVAAKGICTK